MTKTTLTERLKQGVFILDGAMGTQLFARCAKIGQCNEVLNVDQPAIVADVHTAYLAAGCDAVLTNTLGGTAIALDRHGAGDRALELNTAAAQLARSAAGPDKYVLGDIGPCGDFLEPLGPLTKDQLRVAFAEQTRGLADSGVDGFIIETVTATDEIEVAIEAVKSVSDLPILISLAYDQAADSFRTLMGTAPAQAVEKLVPLGITAIGYNCGTLDMESYIGLTAEYAKALENSDVLLLAQPNAGKPELEDGKAVYKLTPDAFAEAMVKIHDAGATLLGGCCGTTPAHIAAAVKKIKS